MPPIPNAHEARKAVDGHALTLLEWAAMAALLVGMVNWRTVWGVAYMVISQLLPAAVVWHGYVVRFR
jgi:hypothetical protein